MKIGLIMAEPGQVGSDFRASSCIAEWSNVTEPLSNGANCSYRTRQGVSRSTARCCGDYTCEAAVEACGH